MVLIDEQQRAMATDPCSSFIVQAPAGSGKTEILTQRYLRLLGTVTTPEQIIALTFTRKAASEMKGRIILALEQAARQERAQSAHQQTTLEFAKRALDRNEQLQWFLLEQSSRLKVCTIDALCQQINQAIPLFEKHMILSKVTNTPNALYINAARAFIRFALKTEQYQQAISKILLHFDNRQDRLLNLLALLLSQRDQWMSLLFQAREQEMSIFEKALTTIQHDLVTQFKSSLPAGLMQQLIQLVRQLATIENNPKSPRYILRDWYFLHEINPITINALAKAILTQDQVLRSGFDHHVGLKRGLCSDEEYQSLKAASKDLLAKIQEYPDFLDILIQITLLPNVLFQESQWEVLQALFQLLPLLLSHLHVYFLEQNEVDFTKISQQAQEALGNLEDPSDLSLFFDARLHHLLIDEFQDTSVAQFELISTLVQGWQRDEGKTLFIVGDPMQSIYRFRQAEVGLFFQAKEQGIGPVVLKFLQLNCNFRSTSSIVHWVNQQFPKIFPKESDINSGAVPFHPSVALIHDNVEESVFAFQYNNKVQEAEGLIQKIKSELQRDSVKTLAILVRSRTHLTQIIRLLRQHHIPYQGSEIDLLSEQPHIIDAYSLTQALLLPANRLFWLALLRSPYCGISLADILCIASFDKKKSIYYALLNLDKIQRISAEGRIRAHFFIQIMHNAQTQRFQKRLSDWVAQTLKNLHMDMILNQKEQEDLEQFFTLLDSYERDGTVPHRKEFVKQLNSLYSEQTTPSRLQVMTIHKSKGLEFDTVFLPSLGALPRRSENPLLRWHKIQEPIPLVLVSPLPAYKKNNCPLYTYLTYVDEKKVIYEYQRLLYVALTRAKSRLYLMDGNTKSPKNSFLSMLKNQKFTLVEQEIANETPEKKLPRLVKLPLSYYLDYPIQQIVHEKILLSLSTSIQRLSGIVAHRLMQWICEQHPKSPEELPWDFVIKEFIKLGFDKPSQQQALSILQSQIRRLFNDAKGLWIIKPQQDERNEYELLVAHESRMVTRVIDRTFIENDKLWIIDFKTGKDDSNSIVQHQLQLNEYKRHLSIRSKNINCGLYYLSNGHWIEW